MVYLSTNGLSISGKAQARVLTASSPTPHTAKSTYHSFRIEINLAVNAPNYQVHPDPCQGNCFFFFFFKSTVWLLRYWDGSVDRTTQQLYTTSGTTKQIRRFNLKALDFNCNPYTQCDPTGNHKGFHWAESLRSVAGSRHIILCKFTMKCSVLCFKL